MTIIKPLALVVTLLGLTVNHTVMAQQCSNRIAQQTRETTNTELLRKVEPQSIPARTSGAALSVEETAALLKKAIEMRVPGAPRYQVSAVKPGEDTVSLAFGGGDKHRAELRLTYTPSQYQLDLVHSDNLRQQSEGGCVYIHRNYNRHIERLVSQINTQLRP